MMNSNHRRAARELDLAALEDVAGGNARVLQQLTNRFHPRGSYVGEMFDDAGDIIAQHRGVLSRLDRETDRLRGLATDPNVAPEHLAFPIMRHSGAVTRDLEYGIQSAARESIEQHNWGRHFDSSASRPSGLGPEHQAGVEAVANRLDDGVKAFAQAEAGYWDDMFRAPDPTDLRLVNQQRLAHLDDLSAITRSTFDDAESIARSYAQKELPVAATATADVGSTLPTTEIATSGAADAVSHAGVGAAAAGGLAAGAIAGSYIAEDTSSDSESTNAPAENADPEPLTPTLE